MFVGSLVLQFVRYARCDTSVSKSLIFIKFSTDVQHLRPMSQLTLERSRSKFKVKTAVLKLFRLQ